MHRLLALFVFSIALLAASAFAAEPLPADGGEPGKVVLAAMAAQRSGDFEQWKKAWHPRVWEGHQDAMRKMIERMREHSPLSERIVGGTIDGDKATVKIEAAFNSASRTTEADLERHEGAWRVTRM
jgi:hypothetical protein